MTRQMADDEVLRVLDRVYDELNGYDGFYPLQYELKEARAAVAALQAERDALRADVDGSAFVESTLENAAAAMTDLRKRAERSEAEVQRLQAALYRWLPMVRGDDDPAADDAMLLFGLEDYEGPDLGEAILQRAERAESALEALHGQVAGLVDDFGFHARGSGHFVGARESFAYCTEKLAELLAIKERMG